MPTYDFICPKCGTKKTNERVKYEERNEQICPECNEKMKIDFGTLAPNLLNVG